MPVHTNEVAGSQYKRGRVTWVFRFRWFSGGDPDRYAAGVWTGEPSPEQIRRYNDDPTPWWMGAKEAATAYGRLHPVRDCPPFITPAELGIFILNPHIARERYRRCVTLLKLPDRMWNCAVCGKVNKLRWIGRYRCTYCASGLLCHVCSLFLFLARVSAELVIGAWIHSMTDLCCEYYDTNTDSLLLLYSSVIFRACKDG